MMQHMLVALLKESEDKEAIIALIVVFYILLTLFSWNLFTFLQKLPKEKNPLKEKYRFPDWFVWLFLIPWVGLVFRWMMLPFSIPKAIKNAYPNNQDIAEYASTLFKLGLAQVVLTTASFFIAPGIAQDSIAAVAIACWILYWVRIVRFPAQDSHAA